MSDAVVLTPGPQGPPAYRPTVVWEPGITYYKAPWASMVQVDGSLYECLATHVSSDDFAADLAAGSWILLVSAQLTAEWQAAVDATVAAANAANEAAQASVAATAADAAATAADADATAADRVATEASAASAAAASALAGSFLTKADMLAAAAGFSNGQRVEVTADGANNGSWVKTAGAFVQRPDIPTNASLNARVAATEAYSRSIYPWVAATVEVAVDADGVVRVLSATNEQQSLSYTKVEAPTPGVASIRDFTLGRSYPDFVRMALDVNGVPRLIEAVGKEVSGATIFGAEGGSTSTTTALPTTFVLFAITGQSNADGRGAGGQAPATGIAYAWKSGALQALADPVGIESNSAGSAWPAFAQEFFERTGMGVVFVPCARGGTTLIDAAEAGFGTWGPSGGSFTSPTLRERAVAAINAATAALTAAGMAYQMGGVIWCEGETVAGKITAGTITQSAYAAGLAPLISYIQSGIGENDKLPWLISRTGYPYNADTVGCQAVRAVQEQWCRDYPNVFLGWTGAITLPGRNLMLTSNSGELHYKQAGYDEMGRALAAVAAVRCLGVA